MTTCYKRLPSPAIGILTALLSLGVVNGPSLNAASPTKEDPPAASAPDVVFTLKTSIGKGKLTFIGVGGSIDSVINPTLRVKVGQVVQVALVNGDGSRHDIAFPHFDAKSDEAPRRGASTMVTFRADKRGEYVYLCTVPRHRGAGMEGRLVVEE